MTDLAFVLAGDVHYPDPQRVIASAEKFGLHLRLISNDGLLSFDLGGGAEFIILLVRVPFPNLRKLPIGPTSPSAEEAASAPVHFILTGLGLQGDARSRDTAMAVLSATVIDNIHAIGVKLGSGVLFHRAGLFSEMAALVPKEGVLPSEVAVDVVSARESDDRMSFLTHGMVRYGREEFWVTCPIEGKGALDFVFSLVRWMLADMSKEIPTGDTLGRTDNEKLEVQRVANPVGKGKPVIRLDLP